MDSEENDMEESPPTVILRIRHCSCCLQREMELPSLSHFRSLTPEKTNHISHIDADVQHTHDTIIKLLHQRAALIRQRNTFVPAVNLPPEILTTIFEFACCPDGDTLTTNASLDIRQNYYRNESPYSACAVTPLFIGSICSAWRSVAWGAPQLWNSITLLYHHKDARKLAEMLEYWLSKSGSLPLSVTLSEDETRYVAGVSFEVIEVIEVYAHRLHTFDLFLPGAWEPALIRIASCAPSLTRFTLRASGSVHHPYPSVQFTNMFADASQLREVTLFGYSTTEVLLPWAHLETLEVDSRDDDVVKLAEILQLCPRLRRFSVSLGDVIWTKPLAISMRHTTVEVFGVSSYNERYHPEFFKMLELPALRSFTLNVAARPREWSSWLPSFLSPVAGTLETLCLCEAAPLDEELVTVLQVVPRLRKLVLDDSLVDGAKEKLTQGTLDLLNLTNYEGLEREGLGKLDGQSSGDGAGTPGPDERRNGHCLVPNLETFEFKGEMALVPHALVEFLVARWRGGSASGLGIIESPHETPEGSGNQAGAGGPLPLTINVPLARKLRSAKFETLEQISFEDTDAEVLQGLRLEGMCLEFLADW